MAKVFKQNVILGGKEYKAGTSETEIDAEVKKLAEKFLVSEKEYKASINKTGGMDDKIKAHIEQLGKALDDETARADKAEKSLSKASDDLAIAKESLALGASQFEELETKLNEAEESFTTANESLELGVSQYAELETKLKKAEESFTTANESLELGVSQYAELETKLKKAEEQLTDLKKKK